MPRTPSALGVLGFFCYLTSSNFPYFSRKSHFFQTIFLLCKQQQASEAQGYSEGGYTPKGRKDQEVGVVHAGEWVASQNSAMVEHTRRIAAGETTQHVVVQNMPAEQSGALDKSTVADLSSTIASLNSRLNEPFVTVNTITGDQGIKKAQDEYARLIRNKTPKSRR